MIFRRLYRYRYRHILVRILFYNIALPLQLERSGRNHDISSQYMFAKNINRARVCIFDQLGLGNPSGTLTKGY